MTTLKILLVALTTSILFISPNTSRSEINTGSKVEELNHQLVLEVKDIVTIPLLKYRDGNLTGLVRVSAKVDDNGKIIFGEVNGPNKNLVSNVEAKLKGLNAWTGPEYAGTIFMYYIKFTE